MVPSLSTPSMPQMQSGESGERGSTSSSTVPETPFSTQESYPPPGQRMPPPSSGSTLADSTAVNQRLIEAGEALSKAITHLNSGGKTGTAKKLAECVLPHIRLAMQSIMRAEVAYGKEQERPAVQPPSADNIAMKLDDLKKGQQEIQTAIRSQSTWANIAARPPQVLSQGGSTRNSAVEAIRKERNQYEVTLDIKEAPDHVKAQVNKDSPAEITKKLQDAINTHTDGPVKPTLNGVNKLANGNIRMQFQTCEDAQRTRESRISWSSVYEGIKVYKPKYSIVVKGVPVEAINLNEDYGKTADSCPVNPKNGLFHIISTLFPPFFAHYFHIISTL